MHSATLRAPWLGESGMAGLIRDFDWSATPLGPLETWSPSLRTSLGMCLHSRFPMVVYWSSELIYLYNDANRDAIGELHPRALGRRAREMLPESWDVLEPRLRAALERGEASWAVDEELVFSFRQRPEAGYFTYSFSPIHEPEGNVGGVLLVTQDTTARVLAGRRIELLRKLAAVGDLNTVEATCEAMVAALEGSKDLPLACIHLAEGATYRCVAASAGVAPALERPVPAGLVPAGELLRGKALPEAAVAVAFDGGVLTAALNDQRIFDDEYRRLIEQVAEQVAHKVAAARLHAGVRRHAREVEALDAAKTAFFSNVSHELRAPLSLVLGSLEQLQPGSEWLDVARRNALRMLRTVNAVLDYSKLEARVHTGLFQPTDLGELSSRLVAMFESAAELAGLELVNNASRSGEPVYVDREAWEKIVGNLLSNALKFTPAGRIVVTTELGDEHASLTVADTGIGIAPENREQVFSRFHRLADPRARSHEGTGIGLALVRELVHLHGGTIEARGARGGGTEMIVRIPRGHAHLPADALGDEGPEGAIGSAASLLVEDAVGWFAGPGPAPREDRWLSAVTAGEARARVLVVDDNADMRAYLTQLLAPYFEVVTARDADGALADAIAAPPDVVVSDVMMPGLDGLEFVRALRANERTRELPIVLLSARADRDRLDALRIGADDYLLKPIGGRELVARVRAAVQLFRARREIAEARGRLEERTGVERDLRAAHRRVVAAADVERRRIERNLHDGAQQRLIAILMRLDAIADDPADPRTALEPVRDELARSLEELRELAHGLFPPLLVSDGLEAALGAAARRSGLPVALQARAVGRLAPELEAAVYFCCLEALQNASKHAGAGARVRLEIERTPRALTFAVQDDGAGFDAARVKNGYGLVNVRDRVEALGGTAAIESAPGRGTTVRGTLPLG